MPVVIPTITSDGNKLEPAIELVSLEVSSELDRIPEARMTLIDGTSSIREFKLANAAFFAPGKRVTIQLRAGDVPDEQVFEGLVVRQAIDIGPDGIELRVELRDPAVVLTRKRKSAVHRELADDEIISRLVADAGLKTDKVDPTAVKHKELVQFNVSDWDFILSRADVNGLVVVVVDGVVSARAMNADEPAAFKLEYGLDSLHSLELELDAGGQWAKVSGVAWDAAEQATSEPVDAADLEPAAGDLDVAAVATTLGGDAFMLHHPVALVPDEIGPWASARLARSRLALLRGRIVIDGRADMRPFDHIDLAGLGKRYDGKLLVSGVTQRVDQDGWRTELQIGLSPDWFARTPDIADLPAGGLLPAVNSLQIGVVTAFEADPDGEHRVKVQLPGLDHADNAVWARVARPDAGKDRGFTFWPEPKDEVVVGFLGGDPRHAVVLGSLHGATNSPPKAVDAPSEKNPMRGIISRSGVELTFDDDKIAFTLKTPAGNTVVVDDDAKAITLADQHGNKITMDDKGITLVSAKDLALEASGNVTIKGSAVDIK